MSTAAETQALWQRVHEQTEEVLLLAEKFHCPACRIALVNSVAPFTECPKCGFERMVQPYKAAE